MIPVAEKGKFAITRRKEKTYLYEGGIHWMDDGPGYEFFTELASGTVGVGGLGLGCVAKQLQANDDVSRIVVVEISQDVIDLVWPHLDIPKATIVHDDLDHYLRTTTEKFDYFYIDVWAGENDKSISNWRKLAEQSVPPDRVLCWGEV